MHLMGLKQFIAVLVGLLTVPVFAKNLSEIEIYRRCYAHLIGESPMLNDPNLSAIRGGSKTANQACNSLLDRMTINPNDAQGRMIDPTDAVAVKGLRNIYNLTNQFAGTKRFEGSITNFFEDYASSEDIFDNTILALAYTENILNENRQFKDLFTMTHEPRASRVVDPMYANTFTMKTIYGSAAVSMTVTSARSRYGQTYYSSASPKNATTAVNPDSVPFAITASNSSTVFVNQSFTPISVGELIGITFNQTPELMMRTPSNKHGTDVDLGFNIHENLAKGVLGLRPYIAASTNWTDNGTPNLQYMHRRLSQNYLKDFLCRDLPVVRESDILNMVSVSSTAVAFRKASSCVRCHATIDPMAASFRNILLIKIGNRMDTDLHRFFVMPHKRNVTVATPEVGWPAEQDNNFHKRPATGKFYFRTYDGKLINRPLANHSELSTAVGETDDAYICFARKMFKHFTGIEVRMFDAGDAANASYMQSLTPEDWEYRNFVVKAGLNLKKHQRAKELMREIMQSPIYKKSNMGKD